MLAAGRLALLPLPAPGPLWQVSLHTKSFAAAGLPVEFVYAKLQRATVKLVMGTRLQHVLLCAYNKYQTTETSGMIRTSLV